MNDKLPDFIRFGRAVCGDLGQAEQREWWLGNGLGAYAAGTVAGTLTRRYHGLLIAPVYPPLGRWLVFAKADAALLDGDREIPLFSNRWGGGAINPEGHVHLQSFHLHGRMPVWRYALGDRVIEQRIWLEPGANTVYVAYRLEAADTPLKGGAKPGDFRLRVRLLVNARDHHVNMTPGGFTPQVEMVEDHLHVICPDRFTLRFQAPGGALKPEWDWIENFDLPVERERGLPDRDAHLCVGQAVLTLHPGVWVGVVASLHDNASTDLDAALQRFLDREATLLDRARQSLQIPPNPPLQKGGGEAGGISPPDWIEQLALAADSFLFARPLPDLPDGESVIAGYPWFGDWGRDTMIALPGLTLATGRLDSARRILLTFARFVDQGMLPNVFPGAGETPDYNTVDAGLWYFEAWRAYLEASNDWPVLAEVFPVLADMIDWHVRGTRYRIGMDPADGLIHAGEPGVQLTWMDAKVGDWVVTPRIGKPVEINALWYNALNIMVDFAGRLEQPSAPYVGTGRQGPARVPAVYPSRRRRPVRRAGQPGWGRSHPTPQSDLRRQPAPQPARPRNPADRGARLRAGIADLLRSAFPGARSSRLPPLLPRWGLGTRWQLSPGAGLGLAAGPLRAGRASRAWRRGGGPGPAGGCGDRIWRNGPGARSARITAPTAKPGNISTTTSPAPASIAGTRMAWAASATNSSGCASPSPCGTAATRSSRNGRSA